MWDGNGFYKKNLKVLLGEDVVGIRRGGQGQFNTVCILGTVQSEPRKDIKLMKQLVIVFTSNFNVIQKLSWSDGIFLNASIFFINASIFS